MPFGDVILQMIKDVREQEPERRIDCPVCGWTLKEKNGVLYCEFDGWTER